VHVDNTENDYGNIVRFT